MVKKKISKRMKLKQVQSVVEMPQKRSNTLIFWGLVLAMSSIGLFVFVLSEKVFHLE
tara:strand:- start:1018 stop:1188 length:171 start_codon:yes stop_codon:yes gene_type:complete